MILDRLLPQRIRAGVPPPDDDYWYNPVATDIAANVTPTTAIQVATVLGCVRVLAETLAQLPLHLMRGRKKATDHPLYRILHTQPNTRHTSFEFREMMQGHLALRGNAFALKKVSSRTGELEGLVPLDPDRIKTFLLKTVEDNMPSEGQLGFLYQDKTGRQYKITQDEMFRVAGLSLDGILGVSPITECRKAVELASQAEVHGVKWWKNAAKPGGVIQFPKDEWLEDEEAHKRLKKSWRDAHTGNDLYTVAILEGGAEWKPMGISNEDSQWLDSRRFQASEICRMFRVPPHMVGLAIEHGNTYANVEQSDMDFVTHTMLPWFVRWEQSILRDLTDDPELSVKFALEGFLRADSRSRAEFYSKLFGLSVYSPNEIRELEDLDPFDGGDQRFVPINMVPIEMAGQSQSKQPKESEPPAPSGALEAWIKDAATRLCNAEARDRASFDKPSWIKRNRDYVTTTVLPIVGQEQLQVVVDGITSTVGHDNRFSEIVSIIMKGANNA